MSVEREVSFDGGVLTITNKIESLSEIKIAAFDLDGTLILPLPGKSIFDHSPDNWRWFNLAVPEVLREISENGFQVVIITNQGGHSIKRVDTEGKAHPLVKKLLNILNELTKCGVNVWAYACVGKANLFYRKPMTGMWSLLVKSLPKPPSNAFYVGDAAGRLGDHSDSDLMFSRNAGISFWVPEQVFPSKAQVVKLKEGKILHKAGVPLMVIMVGYPGSGKSTYIKDNLEGMRVVSQDVMRDSGRSSRKLEEVINDVRSNLMTGESVVVDRTNMSSEDRKKFIDIGKEMGVDVVCIFIDVDLKEAHRRNLSRHESDLSFPKIPLIAYYAMRKKFSKPDPSEGCRVIEILNNEPSGSDRLEEILLKSRIETDTETILRLMDLGRENLKMILDLSLKGSPERDLQIAKMRSILQGPRYAKAIDRQKALIKAVKMFCTK